MEWCCYVQNIHDKLADIKSPYELFIRACEDGVLDTRQVTPIPIRNQWAGKNAVRRVKESTVALLFQCGLSGCGGEKAMESFCHLRNKQEKLADRKSPYDFFLKLQ